MIPKYVIIAIKTATGELALSGLRIELVDKDLTPSKPIQTILQTLVRKMCRRALLPGYTLLLIQISCLSLETIPCILSESCIKLN